MDISIGRGVEAWKWGPFTISAEKHTAIYAETGTGKSVFMADMAIQDIRAGRAVIFIDPHDEAVRRIADYIPKRRLDDVVWIDPLSDKVLGWNPIGGETRKERIKRADQFIDTASKIYGEHSWGGNSAYIARNILYAIIEVEDDPNPLHLFEALMSEDYREEIFSCVTSENLRKFKKKFDEDWRDTQREQNAAAPTNKVDSFIANWIIRAMLCQRPATIDFGKEVERGAIILCALAKGRLGPDASAFLGSLIMQECLFAGLARLKVKPSDRKPVRLYVDEFHNFVRIDSVDFILSELRKFGWSLIAGDQDTDVLPLKNFPNKVAGRVDAKSAADLAAAFARPDLEAWLTTISSFYWCAQGMRENRQTGDVYKTDARQIKGNEPLKREGTEYPARRVIRHSEENRGVLRSKVEASINQFLAA